MITAGDVKVYSCFSIYSLTDMEIELKEGCHGKLVLRGYLSGEKEKDGLPTDKIRVTGKNENGQEELLFSGVIQETYLFYENGIKQIILTALSESAKMDKQKHSRSFQDVSVSCEDIIQELVSGYGGKMICEDTSVKIGRPVIQYEETDWEFCERLASRMGYGIYGSSTDVNPTLIVGHTEGKKVVLPIDKYRCCVDEKYYRNQWKGAGTKTEFLYYQVETEENCAIGDYAHYQGQKRYIFEKKVALQENTLTFTYKMGGKCRFMKEEQYNKKIAGLSLAGKVERTEQENIYLKLDIDGSTGKAIYPYPWKPVAGNLMYCMPQIGTKVYLYFPNYYEENAIAVNSVHAGTSCSDFEDAQKRVLATGHGKQIQLYEDGIYFRNKSRTIEQQLLLGKDGITLKAGMGKLVITGKGGITFNAPVIQISTPQEINQYKMEEAAARKEGGIYPRGSRNPATGGDAGFSMQYEFNGLAAQGVLKGTEWEEYFPFDDAPSYEKDCATWLKVVAGIATALVIGFAVGALVALTGGLAAAFIGVTIAQLGVFAGVVTAGVGIAAVGATCYHDYKNGTASSLGDYLHNAATASAEVGGAIIGGCLSFYAVDLVTLTVTGGLPLIPGISAPITLGEVRLLTLLLASELTASNLSNQLIDVGLFVKAGKPLGAPTGNKYYDAYKATVESLALQTSFLALYNPYLYQNARQNFREIVSRIIPGTGLTVPGSTAVTVASGEGAVTAEQGMAIVNGNTAEVENRASASQQLLSGMAAGNGGGTATSSNRYCLSGEEHYEVYKEMFGAENVEWTSRDTLSSADRLRIQDWAYPPKDELYLKYKDVYQNDLYFNQATGKVNWPNYDGFIPESINYETLSGGTQFMRIGETSGEFLGTITDPFEKRSLAPFSDPDITSTPIKYYELLDDTEFLTGDIAPWFGFDGGGKQFLVYKSDGKRYTVQELLDADILKDITEHVRKGEITIDASIK